jgi:hypothetical protein
MPKGSWTASIPKLVVRNEVSQAEPVLPAVIVKYLFNILTFRLSVEGPSVFKLKN